MAATVTNAEKREAALRSLSPLPAGAATDATLQDGTTHVIVDDMPVVGGDGLTDAELRASPVPVSLASVPSHAVTGPLTDTQLRATPVPVSGTVTATGGLTDTQLRATPVPVSGTVAVTGAYQATQPVSGPVTDAQLRATAVNVTLLDSNDDPLLRISDQRPMSASIPVVIASDQSPVPVSGIVTANVGTGTQPVSGTFWQATQPVSVAAQPGAVNSASSQVATSVSPATLAVARSTRRRLVVKNIDTSITVYVGAATVSSSNGMPLLAGESVELCSQILYQVIAASGTPTVAITDEYD